MKQIFIFLDANFILLPAQLKLDIFREFEALVPKPYELIIISAIFTELEKKAAKSGPFSKLSKELNLAKQILQTKSYQVFEFEQDLENYESVDDLILRVIQAFKNSQPDVELGETEYYLATNDKELRKRALNRGFSTIYVRQSRFLEVEKPH